MPTERRCPVLLLGALAALVMGSGACTSWSWGGPGRDDPVCPAGYYTETGACLDESGHPPPRDPGISPQDRAVGHEDWLGTYRGECGEVTCTLDVVQTPEGDLMVELSVPGEGVRQAGSLRFSGNRATGTGQVGTLQMSVQLQINRDWIYGTWTEKPTEDAGSGSPETRIRFAVQREG